MARRTLTFTIPRTTDGRFHVGIVEMEDGYAVSYTYLLDEQGGRRSFANPSEAWDAAMEWKQAHEQEQQ